MLIYRPTLLSEAPPYRVSGFPQSRHDSPSFSLLHASSSGLREGKINDSQWPCRRLLSACSQFFSPWEGFEMRLFSTDCP